MTLYEGAELVAESGRIYLAVNALGQDNVWIGAEKDKDDHIVILKSPAPNDAPGVWPKFQQEMTMHELLKECPTIREQVDRIAPDESGSPPILVLEMIATTVWMARKKRPFARQEIVAIIKGLLESLRDVHAKGLVYSDVKMPNIMLDGFHNHNPSDGSDLTVKLGDLGEVMHPSSGTAQPIAYRAPEVFFKGEITPAADIWAAGLVLSHLLEAQTNFSETGLYNDLFRKDSTADQSAQALRSAIAHDYDLKNVEYYRECALSCSTGEDQVNRWDGLRERLSPEDVAFLQDIMKADPRERPTAASLLQHAWFKDDAVDPAVSAEVETTTATEVPTVQDKDTATASHGGLTSSHAPIEFQSINYATPHAKAQCNFGASNSAQTINTAAPQDLPTQSHTPIEFQNMAQPAAHSDNNKEAAMLDVQQDKISSAPQDISTEPHAPIKFKDIGQTAAQSDSNADAATPKIGQKRRLTSDLETAPQISPVRAFSPIVFQDINATGVPDDFADEAASRINNAQKRLSARGVESVQLSNQPLVDSKHKRESIHFQPIPVGATSEGSTILNYR